MQAVLPKPAATLVILRDGLAGLEVFMVQRAASMAFGANAMVFPGGKLDPWDENLAQNQPDDADLGRYQCAALREAFEEVGLLLAAHKGVVVSGEQHETLSQKRQALINREMSFSAFLAESAIQAQTDCLHFLARWITPERFAHRYDTYFFGVEAPMGQYLVHDGHEAVHSEWVQPQALLQRAEQGDAYLMPPTLWTLRDLADHYDARTALELLRNKSLMPDQRGIK